MEKIFFNGPEGKLEGRYEKAKSPAAPLALVLHPHPSMGGNMNNKVVYTMFSTFAALGFSTLRFNFRGVGASQGIFEDQGEELSDAAAALDWMQSENKDSRACFVAGHSFGALVGMQLLMRRPDLKGFVAAAPTIGNKDFGFLSPCPVTGLIIQGTKDEIVPEGVVSALAEKLTDQKGIDIVYKTVAGAGHSFDGYLPDIQKNVIDYVLGIYGKKTAKPAAKTRTGAGRK